MKASCYARTRPGRGPRQKGAFYLFCSFLLSNILFIWVRSKTNQDTVRHATTRQGKTRQAKSFDLLHPICSLSFTPTTPYSILADSGGRFSKNTSRAIRQARRHEQTRHKSNSRQRRQKLLIPNLIGNVNQIKTSQGGKYRKKGTRRQGKPFKEAFFLFCLCVVMPYIYIFCLGLRLGILTKQAKRRQE